MEEREKEKQQLSMLFLVNAAILILLIAALYLVLRPFLVPLAWSVIFALLLWPVYQAMKKSFKFSDNISSLITTAGLTIAVLGIIVPLASQVADELTAVVDLANKSSLRDSPQLHERLRALPFVGPRIDKAYSDIMASRATAISNALKTYQESFLTMAGQAISGLVGFIFDVAVTVFSLYFMLLYGESMVKQLRRGAIALGGESYLSLLETVHCTVRASIHGILVTALAQGALAGFGFYMFGAPVPLLLGILTTLFSLLPLGSPLIYVPVAAGMAIDGASWPVVAGLLVWGIAVVSGIDNVIRPIFISHATDMSYLLVLLGILGGVAQFGLLGVFLGPVIIVGALHVWSVVVKRGKQEELRKEL